MRAAARINEVQQKVGESSTKIAVLEPLIKDLSVFGTIKNFVTQSALERATEGIEHSLEVLAAKSNDFVGELDGHLREV